MRGPTYWHRRPPAVMPYAILEPSRFLIGNQRCRAIDASNTATPVSFLDRYDRVAIDAGGSQRVHPDISTPVRRPAIRGRCESHRDLRRLHRPPALQLSNLPTALLTEHFAQGAIADIDPFRAKDSAWSRADVARTSTRASASASTPSVANAVRQTTLSGTTRSPITESPPRSSAITPRYWMDASPHRRSDLTRGWTLPGAFKTPLYRCFRARFRAAMRYASRASVRVHTRNAVR